MTRPHNLGDLKPDQWNKLQDLADRFEEGCKQGPILELADFLPTKDDSLRAIALVELIKVDLELRWRRKQGQTLEDYLKHFPELGDPASLSPSLIFEEYRVRHQFGDKPALPAYQTRFPEQFGRLQQLVRENPPQGSAAPIAASSFAGTSKANTTIRVGEGYKLLQRIGQGSFAEVWRGEAPGGIPVAIKIVLRPIDHEEAKRELHSLELIKRLRHPFLLPSYAFWLDDDRLFIAMELADCSLRERLKQCRQIGQSCLPPKELFTYILESSQALDFLHREHVLHRDIKPENILLLERHAKVADFGLARVLQSQHLMTATSSGTPRYMGPEIWKGKVSQQSDQYALAMTYSELRLGRSPFPSRDMSGMMFDHIERTPDLGDLPEGEKQVLMRALAKEPEERFPNCLTFANELEQSLEAILRPSRGPGKSSGLSSTRGSSSQEETARSKTKVGALAPPEGTDAYRTLLPGVPAELDLHQLSDQETPRPGEAFATLQSHENLSSTLRTRKRVSLGTAVIGLLILSLLGIFGWYLVPRFELLKPEPVKLSAGEAVPFTVYVQRNHLDRAVHLSFANVPDNILISTEAARMPENAQLTIEQSSPSLKLYVTALPDAPVGEYEIKVTAKAGIWSHVDSFTLTVEPLKYFMPPGWRKASDAHVVKAGDRLLYSKIEIVREKLEAYPVPFLYIPGNIEPNIAVAPSYMMETKVWAGLYRAFHVQYGKEYESLDWNHYWKTLNFNKVDRFPVFGVKLQDANRFAQWLVEGKITKGDVPQRGHLPRYLQWDQAAGRNEVNPRKGPFRESKTKDGHSDVAVLWKTASDAEIANTKNQEVNRDARPKAVGEAVDDRSVFDVADMAGNGLEFTSHIVTRNNDEEVDRLSRDLKAGDGAYLRGWSYSADHPLYFAEIDTMDRAVVADDNYDISFRVAFEP